jgi:hypothetical protein
MPIDRTGFAVNASCLKADRKAAKSKDRHTITGPGGRITVRIVRRARLRPKQNCSASRIAAPEEMHRSGKCDAGIELAVLRPDAICYEAVAS